MLNYLQQGKSAINEDFSIMKYWKILVVDDIKDVFDMTQVTLKDKIFFHRKLQFLYAQNIPDAQKILRENNDIAVALIDVKMEEDDSGLQLVTYIREELNNEKIQLVIRTGYPGGMPEDEIYRNYRINDYIEKQTLTIQKLELRIENAVRVFELDNKLKVLNSFMEYTPNFSYIKDREGRYEIACKTMTDMFGLERREDIVGKTDEELFRNLVSNGEINQNIADRILTSIEDDADCLFNKGINTLTKNYPRIARRDGKIEEIHITATKVKLYCYQDDKECFVGIGKDISEIQTFIYNIFHTLRSTSTKLNSSIESAFNIFDIEDIDEYFKLPNDGTSISIDRFEFYKTLLIFRNRIHKLNFFLSTSALDVRELKDPKEISIKSVLDYIINIEHYDLDLKRPEVKIIFDSSFSDYIFNGDIDKLDLCFYNIIDNAIKFSLPVNSVLKNIEINSKDTDESYFLYISNYGKTIKSEEIPGIFDQHKRGSIAKDYCIDGSGFGLYVCKEILFLHKAKISMEVNEKENKTTVIVEFEKSN